MLSALRCMLSDALPGLFARSFVKTAKKKADTIVEREKKAAEKEQREFHDGQQIQLLKKSIEGQHAKLKEDVNNLLRERRLQVVLMNYMSDKQIKHLEDVGYQRQNRRQNHCRSLQRLL